MTPRVLCRVCASLLTGERVLCPRCETPHHADCWRYNGGCALFGCSPDETGAAVVVAKVLVVEDPPLPASLFESRPMRVTTMTTLGLIAILVPALPAFGPVIIAGALTFVLWFALRQPSPSRRPREEESWSRMREEVLKSPDPHPEETLLTRRVRTLLEDPAFFNEAVSGNSDLRDWMRPATCSGGDAPARDLDHL